jgi:phosphatidate cytidylyltransferase
LSLVMSIPPAHNPIGATRSGQVSSGMGDVSGVQSRQSRVRMGILLATVALIVVGYGGWLWTCAFMLIMWLAFKEFKALFSAKGIVLSNIVYYPAMLSFALLAHVNKLVWMWPVLMAVLTLASFQWLFHRPRMTLDDLSASLFSVIYLGVLPVHSILLRHEGVNRGMPFWQQDGLHYMMWLFVVIIMADVGAYYVGKTFGKHLLHPELSPKKTREGAFGGLMFGGLAGVALASVIGFPLEHAFILSTLVIVASALGDLVESKMKREAGLKDSGMMLAGHGGVLDRIDSYIFSCVVAYYYIHWFVHHEGMWRELNDLMQRFLMS